SGMERFDVIVLEVDLDERLPVVAALVQLDVIEKMAREIELVERELRKIACDVARPIEEQPLPVLQRRAAELLARLVREVRRAEQLAAQVVRPAVDRAHD